MAELTPELAPRILEACRANAGEAGEAFSRAFGGKIDVTPGEAKTMASAKVAELPDGPGLALVLGVGAAAAVLLVPEESGMLPPWHQSPDATGRSKLATLAQELATLLLPEELAPTSFQAASVADLRTAVLRGKPAGELGHVALALKCDGKEHEATLIWPVMAAADVLAESQDERADISRGGAFPARRDASQAEPGYEDEDLWERLPAYARSLLRVRVPLRVVLAQRSQTIDSIVRLGAGSIIQFEKSCEEMLDLEVGGQRIAQGEVVKVGEKFGIRVTSVSLPEERFRQLRAPRGRE